MAKHCPISNPSSFFLNDALYCSEDNNWDGGEVVDFDNFQDQHFPPILLPQDLTWEDDELSSLFSKQDPNQLYKKLETNPSLAQARRDAVDWILKVNAHYSFTVLSSVLAINYLDRFLFKFDLQTEKPWMTQLVAVACLSLAAKLEETQVPLLLDLQVEDSKYVFEAKTIQRMELLVLSTLEWRMNPVTPLSFIDYIARRLGFKDYLCWEFIRRSELIVLSIISDSRSLPYLPSVIASATMLHVINGIQPSIGDEFESQLSGILGIDKEEEENVNECKEMIMEYYRMESKKRKYGWYPGSPKCVMDVSFSSESSNDSWAVGSVSSSPEQPTKKSRANQNADTSSLIPNLSF
ncbi:cyclin-D3-1-like [Euphorbia lathyris]|uniref:cyclin-D3-1-like n=1 Tax=Euphorbia lathyris TaxID=212925 RepID=UPI0033131874